MGVPEPELTPKVRAALMAEVEELRRDLSRTRERLADLERLADQDPLTPIANRRAFVRELSKVMSFTEGLRRRCELDLF
jgi:GGDEF domain-containing protein